MKTFRKYLKENKKVVEDFIISAKAKDGSEVFLSKDNTFTSGYGYIHGKKNATHFSTEDEAKQFMNAHKKDATTNIASNANPGQTTTVDTNSLKVVSESAKKLTEARRYDDRAVDFDNLAGGIRFTRGIHGLYAQMFAGGSGFDGEWNSKEYMNAVTSNDSHVFDDYLEGTEKKLVKELADLCSKFDKDFERLMNKYRFKK